METTSFSYKFYKTTATAWDGMFEAIQLAKKSIFWEIYILIDDAAGNRFIELLGQKAKSGVEVKIIVDALGSSKLSDKSIKILTAAGAKVLLYNRYHPQLKLWNWYYRFTHRNHRKVLIIDEEIAFLGGVNVKADFKEWDDFFVRLNGIIARPLLRGFAKSYISSGGERKEVKHLLHPFLQQGIPELTQNLRFIVHSPSKAKLPRTKFFYLKALAIAKERVNILTPYFVPDRSFLSAVSIATARGVKVNIFLPRRPDVQLMELLSRTYFEQTINAGAEIYLLPRMHHGKALSVDDNLGLVGSINLMPRSFSHQEESAVSFVDGHMVSELNVLFEELKSTAEKINLDQWLRRHWKHRLREWLAKKFESFV